MHFIILVFRDFSNTGTAEQFVKFFYFSKQRIITNHELSDAELVGAECIYKKFMFWDLDGKIHLSTAYWAKALVQLTKTTFGLCIKSDVMNVFLSLHLKV